MRVNKHHTLGVKESMPQFAFSHSGFHHSWGEKKKKNPKPTLLESQVLTQAFPSWGLMIPIQNCATFRVAGKTISFVGMKGWSPLTSAEFGLFMLAENLALKLLVAL